MNDFEKLKQHLVRLKAGGIKKAEFNVQFLLNALESKPLEPINKRRMPSKVALDGGKFEDDYED